MKSHHLTIISSSCGRIVGLMGLVSRNVATRKARVRTFVHPSVRRSVRWFISDGFVMLLLFCDLWPWTYGRMVGDVYGRGSGLVCTTVTR